MKSLLICAFVLFPFWSFAQHEPDLTYLFHPQTQMEIEYIKSNQISRLEQKIVQGTQTRLEMVSEFNKHGRLTKRVHFDGADYRKEVVLLAYNAAGNVEYIVDSVFDREKDTMRLQIKLDIKYDNEKIAKISGEYSGNRVEWLADSARLGLAGDKVYYKIYLDNLNNITRQKIDTYNGQLVQEYFYENSEISKMASSKWDLQNKPVWSSTTNYIYDRTGNVIEENLEMKIFRDQTGTYDLRSGKTLYSYNDDGKITSYTIEENGEPYLKKAYHYKDGLLRKIENQENYSGSWEMVSTTYFGYFRK